MIYVITHKEFDDSIIPDQGYGILHVGQLDDCDDKHLRDDSGDSISQKNAYYCELTGLFWIWKNGKEMDNDIVGLNHYRRYFTTEHEDNMYKYLNRMPSVARYELLEELLSEHDIVLPKPMHMMRTIEEFYCQNHIPEDIELTRRAIIEKCPEYVASYNQVMESHDMYFANMFACRKKLMDEYCRWLFEIFDELEKNIDINKYESSFQKRVFGFIGERLLQVWVVHNNLRIAELPAFNTEKKSLTGLEINYNRLKYGLTAKLKKSKRANTPTDC